MAGNKALRRGTSPNRAAAVRLLVGQPQRFNKNLEVEGVVCVVSVG